MKKCIFLKVVILVKFMKKSPMNTAIKNYLLVARKCFPNFYICKQLLLKLPLNEKNHPHRFNRNYAFG